MAQAMINFRMDSDEKSMFEDICEQLGLTVTSALKIFAKKVIRERRIPFDVSLESDDPFYSENNMRYLSKIAEEVADGSANLVEHDLIEVE